MEEGKGCYLLPLEGKTQHGGRTENQAIILYTYFLYFTTFITSIVRR